MYGQDDEYEEPKIELVETPPEPAPKPEAPIQITNIDDLVVLTKQFAKKHEISYADALQSQVVWDQVIHMKRMENQAYQQQQQLEDAQRIAYQRAKIGEQIRKNGHGKR